MKLISLLLALLGTAAAQLGQTVATLRTSEFTSLLTVNTNNPGGEGR